MISKISTNRIFLITLAISWVTLLLIYYYMSETCVKTISCSGEFGIYFVVLGIPWWWPLQHQFPNAAVYIGILINSALASYAIQLIWKFIARKRLKVLSTV